MTLDTAYRTIQEFIEQSKINSSGVMFDPLAKLALFDKADDPLKTTHFWTDVYGAVAWDYLNTQARFWNFIRKVPLSATNGWYNRDSGTTTAGYTEAAALPDFTRHNFQQISSNTNVVLTPYAVTLQAAIASQRVGNLANVVSESQRFSMLDHAKGINELLLKQSHGVVTTSGASGVGVVKPVGIFQPGDTLYHTGSTTAGIITVVSHNATTGVLTYTDTGSTGNLVDGNEVVVKTRGSITSMADIMEADGRTFSGANADDVDAYGLTTRTAGTYAAAIVKDNAAVHRPITLDLLDDTIQAVKDAGGMPNLILTSSKQANNLARLNEGKQRYTADSQFQVAVNGELTYRGYDMAFRAAAYDGIPILTEDDMPKSYTEPGVDAGADIYVLDTSSIQIAVARPTQLLTSSDPFAINMLGTKGFWMTAFELQVKSIGHQAKITDLQVDL